jgi:hypothetical protein
VDENDIKNAKAVIKELNNLSSCLESLVKNSETLLVPFFMIFFVKKLLDFIFIKRMNMQN